MHVDSEEFISSNRFDQFTDGSKAQGFSRVESLILTSVCEVRYEAVYSFSAKIFQRIDNEQVFEEQFVGGVVYGLYYHNLVSFHVIEHAEIFLSVGKSADFQPCGFGSEIFSYF